MIRPVLLTTVLLVFLGLAFWAGRWSLADFHTYPARFILDDWEDAKHTLPHTGRAPQDDMWFSAMDALAKSKQLAPGNANTFMTMGRMHHRRALTQIPWSDAAKSHWQHTMDAYQQALQLRPAWGHTWILLAQAQVQSGKSTKAAISNMMRAITLAPWSGDVQTAGVRLGFALWPLLKDAQKEQILTLTERAFPRYGDIILKQAVTYKHLPHIRPFLEKNPQWQATLDTLLKTR